jgi:hypothetical protein
MGRGGKALLWLQLLEGGFKLIYRDKKDEAAN